MKRSSFLNKKEDGNKSKSGFTMVELLFVMVIVGVLAAIAIPQLSGGKTSAAITAMKSDATSAISTLQTYAVTQGDDLDYSNIEGDYKDTSGDGKSDTKLKDTNLQFAISKNDNINVKAQTCENGESGYILKVSNPLVPNKVVSFDSCKEGKIHMVDSSSSSTN